MNRNEITDTIKDGDTITLMSGAGYPEQTGKVYGIKKSEWGYSIRVKIEDENGNTSFNSVCHVYAMPEGASRPIGAYKL